MSEACSHWTERLVSLLYADTDESERGETLSHLAECSGCRAELERLGSTREYLSAWPNAAHAPRMVYVTEPSRLPAALRGWAAGLRAWQPRALLAPAVATAALALLAVALTALLDLSVAPDGSLRIGRLAGTPAAVEPADTPVTRAQLRDQIADLVAYVEEALESRSQDERRLLIAAIDEHIQEQGLGMSQQLRVAIDDAFTEVQRQHEGDLGLIFSAIDEMGLMTAAELQRIHAVLGSMALTGPDF